MDADAKKTALRMIPYGIYVLTAEDANGNTAAATVNWVTQTSFDPPLIAVGVKTDSGAYNIVKTAGNFALNMLGKGQQGFLGHGVDGVGSHQAADIQDVGGLGVLCTGAGPQ